MRILILLLYIIMQLFCGDNFAQIDDNEKQSLVLDLSDFDNSARHWYFIKDKDKIIEPLSDQQKYLPEDYVAIANNILLFQKENGGWPKNYDMQAVLTEEQKISVLKDKNRLNTTFDNSTTWGQLNYLAKVYALTGNKKYKQSYVNGISYILSAQYKNGGWPQFFPDTAGYSKHITFNDGAMIGILKLLKQIVEKDSVFNIISAEQYDSVFKAYNKGIECILNCQIKFDNTLLVWCQQHNNITLLPANARTYELASLCNGESAGITEFLMSIPNPNEKIINSVNSAVSWFKKSGINGIKIQNVEAPLIEYEYSTSTKDRIIVKDSTAPTIWARYYSLTTLRPIFCNRDGNVVDTFEQVDRERRAGYGWYVYDPQEILDSYNSWLKKVKMSN